SRPLWESHDSGFCRNALSRIVGGVHPFSTFCGMNQCHDPGLRSPLHQHADCPASSDAKPFIASETSSGADFWGRSPPHSIAKAEGAGWNRSVLDAGLALAF
ncbi:hypothetical protein, partial [Paracoccus hibiscisoli]|uniref:hypothetical protein n=1 Tax=Paracoccus hibiscisoli TaxID=2023261 RepID=UPI0023F060F0